MPVRIPPHRHPISDIYPPVTVGVPVSKFRFASTLILEMRDDVISLPAIPASKTYPEGKERYGIVIDAIDDGLGDDGVRSDLFGILFRSRSKKADQGGVAFKIENKGSTDACYIINNLRPTGYDASGPTLPAGYDSGGTGIGLDHETTGAVFIPTIRVSVDPNTTPGATKGIWLIGSDKYLDGTSPPTGMSGKYALPIVVDDFSRSCFEAYMASDTPDGQDVFRIFRWIDRAAGTKDLLFAIGLQTDKTTQIVNEAGQFNFISPDSGGTPRTKFNTFSSGLEIAQWAGLDKSWELKFISTTKNLIMVNAAGNLQFWREGESYPRFVFKTDTAEIQFSSGAADVDTVLYRRGPGQLQTDAEFWINGRRDALNIIGHSTPRILIRPSDDINLSWDIFTIRNTVTGYDWFYITKDGALNWGSGTGAVDTNLYRGGADTLKTDDSLIVMGSLGVGTSPATSFHVTGIIRCDWGIKLYKDVAYIDFYNAAGSLKATLGIWGNDFYISNLAGNVGIGTTFPGARLDVRIPYDKTDTASREGVHLYTQEGTNPAGLAITLIGAAAQADRVVSLQTTEVAVANAGNLALQPYGGKVGIGTTSPAKTLHVVGQGHFTEKAFANQYFEAPRIRAGTAFEGTVDATLRAEGASGSVYIKTKNAAGTFVTRMGVTGGADTANVYFENSNVGIGVTTPEHKLHIAPVRNVEPVILEGPHPAIGFRDTHPDEQDWEIFVDHYFHISTCDSGFTAFTHRFTINPDGNIGIGTPYPDEAKLVVVGNINLRDSFLKFDQQSSAAKESFLTRISGDTAWRFTIYADGKMYWGPGSAGQDVNLYRGGPDILKTDNQFHTQQVRILVDDIDAMSIRPISDHPVDAVTTLRDSTRIQLRGRYWDGTTSVDRDAHIFHDMVSTTPTSRIKMMIAGVDYLRLGDADFYLAGSDVNLYREGTNVLKTDDSLFVGGGYVRMTGGGEFLGMEATSSGWNLLSSQLAGDTGRRFTIYYGGKIGWGPGDGTFDVDLYRTAGNYLRTGSAFRVDGSINVGGKLWFGSYGIEDTNLYRFSGNQLATDDDFIIFSTDLQIRSNSAVIKLGSTLDVNLYRYGANELATDDVFKVVRSAATQGAYTAHVSGDSIVRLAIFADGKIEWGDGTNLRDVKLYRAAPDVLKTDDNLDALALRMGGTEVITSGRVLQNITSATIASLKYAGEKIEYAGTDGRLLLSGSTFHWDNGAYIYLTGKDYTTDRGSIVALLCYDSTIPTEAYFRVWVRDVVAATTTKILELTRAGQLYLPISGREAGIRIGDANLFRGGTNILRTDSHFHPSGAGDQALGDDANRWSWLYLYNGISIQDTNLYRSAANVLKTDDFLEIGGGTRIFRYIYSKDLSDDDFIYLGSASYPYISISTRTTAAGLYKERLRINRGADIVDIEILNANLRTQHKMFLDGLGFSRASDDALIELDNRSATNQVRAAGLKITTKATVVDTTCGLVGWNQGIGDFAYIELTTVNRDVGAYGGTGIAIDIKDGISQSGTPAYAYQSKLYGYYDIGLHIFTDPARTATCIQQLIHLKPRVGAVGLDIRDMGGAGVLISLGVASSGGSNKIKWFNETVTNVPYFIHAQTGASAEKMSWRYGDNVTAEHDVLTLDKNANIVAWTPGAGGYGFWVQHRGEANPRAKLEADRVSFGPGGASALDTFLVRVGVAQLSGSADNVLELGTDTVRLKRVRAVNVVTGHLSFQEKVCHICGGTFKKGETLKLTVVDVENETKCLPVHDYCLGG